MQIGQLFTKEISNHAKMHLSRYIKYTSRCTMPYFRIVAHTSESSVFRSNLTPLLPDAT